MVATLGVVPGSSLSSDQLDAQALVLAASGIGFSTVISAATTSTAQGRPDFVVPVSVSTFCSSDSHCYVFHQYHCHDHSA